MDRIKVQCVISGQETNLQLDKKSMPGETGPSYMITTDGSFKGYIACPKNGKYKALGTPYYTAEDLLHIIEQLTKVI